MGVSREHSENAPPKWPEGQEEWRRFATNLVARRERPRRAWSAPFIGAGVVVFLATARLVATWSGGAPILLLLAMLFGAALYTVGMLAFFLYPRRKHPGYGAASVLNFALFAGVGLALLNYGIGGTLGLPGSLAAIAGAALSIALASRAARFSRLRNRDD